MIVQSFDAAWLEGNCCIRTVLERCVSERNDVNAQALNAARKKDKMTGLPDPGMVPGRMRKM